MGTALNRSVLHPLGLHLGRARTLPAPPDPACFDQPRSQCVTSEQIRSAAFEQWRQRFGMRAGLNRKLWEYLYIAQALDTGLDLARAPRILGFGVGRERLPAVLAAAGAQVLATDYAPPGADAAWTAHSLEDLLTVRDGDWDPALRERVLCDPDTFRARVGFRAVDMTRIPDDLTGFDALWSCGSLEHIGGLQPGRDFIHASLRCLRPGGLAVHTTEFNRSSDVYTLDTPELCAFRRRDVENLAQALRAEGHALELCWDSGDALEDRHVDVAPYRYELSLNALVGCHVITSIGLIVRKGGAV